MVRGFIAVHKIKTHGKFARLSFYFYNRCTFEIKEEMLNSLILLDTNTCYMIYLFYESMLVKSKIKFTIMRWKRLKLKWESHISHLSKIFPSTSSILSKLWKSWFSLSLHVNFRYNDLWNGCKVFVPWPSRPTKARFNYWFNFYSLNYKQKTDIFHCLPTFTLFAFFGILTMEIFSNRAFVWLEENMRNTLNST